MKRKAVFDYDEDKSIFIYGEIAEAYEKDVADFDSMECKHEKVTRRLWTLNSKATQLKDFCDFCGKDMSKALKQSDFPGEHPPFDDSVRRHYVELREGEKKKLVRKYVALQKARDRKLVEDSENWRDEYQAYRRT